MVGRKHAAFLTLILLSLLMASLVLSPSLITVPPNTKSFEDLFRYIHFPGNETNETGPPLPLPVKPSFTLIVTGAGHTHYLRREVYTDYVNGTWITRNTTALPQNVIAPPELTVPHHAERDEVRIVAIPPLTGNLYGSLYTTRVTAPGTEVLPEYNIFRTSSSVESYTFSSVGYTFDLPHLLNLTAGNQTEYLYAPGNPKLRALAGRFTRGATSDYIKALSIMRKLLLEYKINENATPPTGTDRLEWFLLESHEGTPYDFASAFVVLARLSGLPARLVKGLYIDAVPQRQVVTEENIHYWGEVYFNGAGWLIFDPLHPDPNVFMPFELEVYPSNLTLGKGEIGVVTLKLMRVSSDINATLTIKDPEGRTLGRFEGAGIYTVTVGPFERPGYYPIMVNASEEGGNFSIVRFIPITVPGNFTAKPEAESIFLLRGGQNWVDVSVKGLNETPTVESESRFLYMVMPVWGPRGFSLGLMAERDERLGWHVEKFVVSSSRGDFLLYVPILVGENTEIRVDVRNNATAGESIEIAGTVEAGGKGINVGEVFSYFVYGNRTLVLGYTNPINGTFRMKAKLPRNLPPGTYDIYTVLIIPLGIPYLSTTTMSEVRVKGLSTFKVPERVVSTPGKVVVGGFLLGADGRELANESVSYILDGNTTGNVSTGRNGKFLIAFNFTSIENHSLRLIYEGNENYSKAEANVEIFTVRVEVPEEIRAEIGKPIVVSGKVVGLEDGTIKVFVFPGASYTAQVVNGTFSITIVPFQTVGERSIDFRHDGNILARSRVVVVSPVKIELLTSKVEGKEKAEIRLKVVDSTEEPVKELPLRVEMGNLSIQVKTNESGIAVFEVPVPEKKVETELKVLFEGSSYYLPTSETFRVVISRKREIPWLYIGLAVLLGALILRYRLSKRTPTEEKPEKILKIIFNNGIPLFREGEVLDISVECDGQAELYVDGEFIGRGRDFKLVLPLGEHTIEARCGELVERATARVVQSYNDAVVEYYERCFLPWARGVGVEVDEMTPREIAASLTEMMYPWEPIEVLTAIFERAKYSPLEVSRAEFIRFYRAMLTLTGGGCVV